MRKKTLNRIKGFIGLGIIILTAVLIYFWESYGKDNMFYIDCIVLNKDIPKNTTITKELLEIRSIPKNLVNRNTILDIKEIVDLVSKQFIPQNNVLDRRYFDKDEYILDENEFIIKLPNNWIKAAPSTLRRKDSAQIYPVKNKDATSENIEIYDNEYDIKSNFEDSAPLFDVIVAYIKDSANREVEDLTLDRLYASANIASIEIICTKEKLHAMEKYVNNGYSFIIVYK